MNLLALLLLPLPALAATGYFCELPPHTGAHAPTYTCGKECGLDNYNTQFDTYTVTHDTEIEGYKGSFVMTQPCHNDVGFYEAGAIYPTFEAKMSHRVWPWDKFVGVKTHFVVIHAGSN
ncbi:uncharacterized protein BDV14DRAFT_204962 [Aspergillus stella-maris]|uniref:uncharacterized protein n=1 Tax=Aspergillus stella-maris TaxID=1810926 RepID=UPI003CCE263C